MVETISLEWLSANVRQLQADIRTLRSDIALLNKRIDIIVDRVAMFEAKVESRLVQIDTNMGILLASDPEARGGERRASRLAGKKRSWEERSQGG